MTCNTLPVPVAVGDEHISLNFSSGSYTYSLSNRHRGRASDKKSTWTVNTTIEVELFEESMQKSYININNQLSWNIHSTYIGHDKDGSNVKLARFDSRNATNNEWHGYPVDYSKDPNNRPSKEILNEWVKRSIITNSEMIKILRGKEVKALL